MKREISIILIAASAVLSCAREKLEPSEHGDGAVAVIQAEAPEYCGASEAVTEAGGKTVMPVSGDNAYSVLWSSGDAIGIVDCEDCKAKGRMSSAAGAVSAAFTYSPDDLLDEAIYAFYPYDSKASVSSAVVRTTLPVEQTFYPGYAFSSNMALMSGKISSGKVSFKNCCAVVEVKLTGSAKIYDVTLSSSAGMIAGQGKFDMKATDPVFSADASKGSHQVRIDLGEGVQLGSQAKSFYFLIAPGSYNDLMVSARTDNYTFEKRSSKSHTFTAGHVKPLSALAVASEGIYRKDGYLVQGVIKCGDKLLKDVVMSDGVNVTKTDGYGRYWLPSDLPSTDFITISVPSGYKVALDGTYKIIPQCFKRLTSSEKSSTTPITYNVSLTAEDQSVYHLFAMGDMHLQHRQPEKSAAMAQRPAMDETQYKNNYLAYLKSYISETQKTAPVYIVNLGDMTMCEWWKSGGTFDNYKNINNSLGTAVYHVIGNHDYDNSKGSEYAMEAEYRSKMMPTYYSFNIGRHHYQMLDDMVFRVGEGCDGFNLRIDDRQLAWIKKDIEAMDPSIKDLIVCCHVPIYRLSSTGSGKDFLFTSYTNLENIDQLMPLYSGLNVTFLGGHIHKQENIFVSNTVKAFNVTAIGGAYWYNTLCGDGVPASLIDFTYSGAELTGRTTVPLHPDYRGKHYRIFTGKKTFSGWYTINPDSEYYMASGKINSAESVNPFIWGTTSTPNPSAVFLFCWEWQRGWTCKVYEDGVERQGEYTWRYDLDYRDMCIGDKVIYASKYDFLYPGRHIVFMYQPQNVSNGLVFDVYDENGERRFRVTTGEGGGGASTGGFTEDSEKEF